MKINQNWKEINFKSPKIIMPRLINDQNLSLKTAGAVSIRQHNSKKLQVKNPLFENDEKINKAFIGQKGSIP